jgi:hypothetical protein
MMSRLTLRQRLIAIAFGGIVAIVEAYVPAPNAVHAAANAPAATCATQSSNRC